MCCFKFPVVTETISELDGWTQTVPDKLANRRRLRGLETWTSSKGCCPDHGPAGCDGARQSVVLLVQLPIIDRLIRACTARL
jgi:hypothetical protein